MVSVLCYINLFTSAHLQSVHMGKYLAVSLLYGQTYCLGVVKAYITALKRTILQTDALQLGENTCAVLQYPTYMISVFC